MAFTDLPQNHRQTDASPERPDDVHPASAQFSARPDSARPDSARPDSAHPTRTGPVGAARPRRELVVFLATTFGLTAASTAVAVGQSVDVTEIGDASALGQAAMYGQAAWPLVGAFAARLATRRQPGGGWGWCRPSARVLALSWLYGISYPLLAGVLLWLTGLGGFDGAELADGFGLGGLPGTAGAALAILLGLTLGCIPYVVLAIGEEVGWRGVLLPHLAATNSPGRVVLLGGLIWSAFHLPIIVLLGGTPDGVPEPVAALFFTVALTALGTTLAWQRLRFGLWPAIVTHAAVNATLYTVIEPATVERSRTGWFGTETGLLLALTAVAAAFCWSRRAPLRPSARAGVVAAVRATADGGASAADARPPAAGTPFADVPDGAGCIDTSDMFVVHAMFRHQFGLAPDLVRGVRTGDPTRARAVGDHVDLLLTLLHEHHVGEDRVLWPLLVERAPVGAGVAAAAVRQHERIAALVDEVGRAAAAWRPDGGAAARDRLAGLLEDLDVAVDEHLGDEERVVVPLAARLLTKKEWSALGGGDGPSTLSRRQILLSLGMIEHAAGPEGLARLTVDLPTPARSLVARLARRTYRRAFQVLVEA